MHDFLIAISGGLVVAVVGLLTALGAAFLRAHAEVTMHNRLTAEHDEDLASWISDRDLLLRRQLQAKTAELSGKQNLFWSGTHGKALAELKEQALHEYRDQLRIHKRAIAALHEREGWTHGVWRRGKPRPEMLAPERGEPILSAWRAEVTRHCGEKGPALEVVDPTCEDLDSALVRLDTEGLKAYV